MLLPKGMVQKGDHWIPFIKNFNYELNVVILLIIYSDWHPSMWHVTSTCFGSRLMWKKQKHIQHKINVQGGVMLTVLYQIQWNPNWKISLGSSGFQPLMEMASKWRKFDLESLKLNLKSRNIRPWFHCLLNCNWCIG